MTETRRAASSTAAEDAPSSLLATPEAERLAERLLRAEEARAEERLDGCPITATAMPSPAIRSSEWLARMMTNALVENDEGAPERFEDRFEVRPSGTGHGRRDFRHGL